MIFAINKIDKDGANPEKIREALSGMNILVEEWGGQYQCQEISAKILKRDSDNNKISLSMKYLTENPTMTSI
jgi:hypothetical protein